MPASAYTFSEDPQLHPLRRREILSRHPEAKDLTGPYRPTAFIILGLVGAQLALSYFVRDVPIWLNLVGAYVVGAVMSHALYVMIHEATHNLVLKKSWGNKLMGIAANLPTVVPSAIPFRKYHLLHHAKMGEPDHDADLPSAAEGRWVGNSTLRKAIWMLFFSIAQSFRPAQIRGAKLIDGWTVANLVAVLAVDAAVWIFFGPTALLYLTASTLFGLGLHPLGGRWIQEHFVTHPGQETYSYYGAANWIAFNVGYHNEHHDMLNVAWNRLPALRRTAPELYDDLVSYRSWTAVLLRFIFDRNLSPHSRVVRAGKASL